MKKVKSNHIKRMSPAELTLHVFIVLFALLSLFPLYWLISNTFKYSDQVVKMPPDWIPRQFMLDHYVSIFTTTNALKWLINSMIVACTSTLLIVVVSSMAAYAFSKLDFWGSKWLYVAFISTLMIPKESYIVPLFTFMRDMKLTSTYASMILPVAALPFGTFLLRSFFFFFSNEIRESGKIDGANETRIFVRLILPMATAGLGALFILMFVRCWNDYLWQLLMAKKDTMKTLMVGIASLMEDNRPDYARKLTGSAISAIVMVIVFLSFQRFFTRGISIGAVKG